MKHNKVILRCKDGAEAVVFNRYIFDFLNQDSNVEKAIDYEINIEDSYVGGDYKGFFGRLKRAWKAFTDKPVIYTGVYCSDKDMMRTFLNDCLALVEEN